MQYLLSCENKKTRDVVSYKDPRTKSILAAVFLNLFLLVYTNFYVSWDSATWLPLLKVIPLYSNVGMEINVFFQPKEMYFTNLSDSNLGTY